MRGPDIIRPEPPPLAPLLARITLFALTVRQPWATAIALADAAELGDRAKMLENRNWPPWERIVGTHIAIHAGAAGLDANDAIDVGRLLYGQDAAPEVWRRWIARLASTAGHIVCVARVIGSTDRPIQLPSQRRWRDPRAKLGWMLDDVRALPTPILARGAQGLWAVPSQVETQIRAQVGL